MTKAIYKGRYQNRYEKNYATLFYEYRGVEYMVTAPTNWMGCSSDYIYGSMRLSEQHKREQARIDDMLDHPEKQEPKPYSGPTLEEIFELMERE